MDKLSNNWILPLNSSIPIHLLTKVVPTKGNLVYEYNPLRNYRLSKPMYEYNDSIYSKLELLDNFGISMSTDLLSWINLPSNSAEPILKEAGELVDFITDLLTFSLEHPVSIVPLHSYDGSVNLIINDGINIPRLINTRFSATGKNTYEVVDRKGNNDTNIYDQGDLFDIDTSLYKRIVNIPKLNFQGTESGGNLKVGNYHFYFKLADADGNETDFTAESGLVSIFVGFDGPGSVYTGNKNENSFKSILFLLSEIDPSYDYVYVYYSRCLAEGNENAQMEYGKVDLKYKVNNLGICNVKVTGFENIITLQASDINLNYNIVSAAYALTSCLNMLFLGNVHKPDIPYLELQDLSLRFLPFLKDSSYDLSIDLNYTVLSSSLGYYDTKYIYDKLGYWDKEIYRLGIVYIMPNNELSPVFNIRGANHVSEYNKLFYSNFPIYENKDGELIRKYISYNEESNLIILESGALASFENVKGVIRLDSLLDSDIIHGIDIRVDNDTILELKKYVKGYFFVRQTRIPTILAQGVTIGIDKQSRTPTIPTKDGIIDTIKLLDLSKTYIETNNINGVNYISEGFLSRYRFSLKKKGSILGVISSAISYAATVCSFVPGVGSIVNIGLNTANFIASTIAKGRFATGAFVGALASAIPIAGSAASKVIKSAALSAKVSKVGELLNKVSVSVGDISKFDNVTSTTLKISTAALSALNTKNMTSYLASLVNAVSYKGRFTEVPKGYERKESNDSRIFTNEFEDRVILKDPTKNDILGIICPDYEVNQAYLNLVFTGNNHILRYTKCQGINFYNLLTLTSVSNYFNSSDRHFYFLAYYDINISPRYNTKIIGIPDNVKCLGIDNLIFRSRAGEAEEAWRYESVGTEYDNSGDRKNNSDIVRGSYGAYLACDSSRLDPATIVDIMIPEYSDANMETYFNIRMNDSSVFLAISDRIDINRDLEDYLLSKPRIGYDIKNDGYAYELYRGDCYLCLYTHRVIRNFNDPSAPYNDDIVDEKSWKSNYDPDKTEKYAEINLGDVNAVQLGMWVTFRLRSSNNLNIRSLDSSHVDEAAMCGHPRGFYPYHPMSVEGSFKHPESLVYNSGFSKSLSERWNFEIPDVPHIKNWFGTRIMYSDIHINDAYKNGYRVFQGTHYRDYTREYGEIVKLISLESNLLCIFEHGVALIPVNERAVAGEGSGGNVYINTSNVLPENPIILSDMFGSQWSDSVLKVPGKSGDSILYVYGVDTVAKKIWRTDGKTLTCISDFRVQEFLNNNITLGERELTPKLGIRNVKTVYNAYKRDVLFTFYDNTYGHLEKAWNLCWNEVLQKFTTFYSWVPSFMENINNIPFSFDRNVSKWIAKLGVSHTENSFADGITLSNTIINNKADANGRVVNNLTFPLLYINKEGVWKEITGEIASLYEMGFIGKLSLSNRILPDALVHYRIKYELLRDPWGNYKKFEIVSMSEKSTYGDGWTLPSDAMYAGSNEPLYCLRFKTNNRSDFNPIYYRDKYSKFITISNGNNPEYDRNWFYTYLPSANPESLMSEMYYRNKEGHPYSDYEVNKLKPDPNSVYTSLPIYKDIVGKRPTLPREDMINPDKLVTLLNVRAVIEIIDEDNQTKVSDAYYNMKAGFQEGTTLVNAGYYESTIAITPKFNLLFLTSDFWKHGLAGLIDIADDIYPTYWYGKLHPFEFECIVVNDPATHKIFDNLEIVANKAQPESFHYEVIGESYDFAKDKPNMYFRLEAMKALWLYNGADISYNRNFLKTLLRLQPKSADFPHKYYTRLDTVNDIEDYYLHITYPEGHDYRHLSGAEIVYYPNRLEYRVWNHALAVNIDNLPQDNARSLIASNCRYLEDRWKVTINPINIVYKNEYKTNKGILISQNNTTWANANNSTLKLPTLPIYNSPIPNQVLELGLIVFPGQGGSLEGKDNALYGLYDLRLFGVNGNWKPLDTTNWLNDVKIYNYNFGEAHNRIEAGIKDKFMKVRIRYSGEELAVIDFLNTVYRISYS